MARRRHLWRGVALGRTGWGGMVDDVRDRLETALCRSFRPERLEITDFSAAHAGHDGARPGGQTHFRVEIVAAAFTGLSRLARQRLVMDAAADLLRHEIHALTVRAVAPGERGTA